ncbi:MAG: hypothetical protein LUC86_06095 [Prevotellaceae bacterium]|nr:hypothetical protein [Prevotellaceae bacterium]
MIKRTVKWLMGLATADERVSLHKTLVFNLYAFGLKGLFKLPVIVHHRTRIYHVGKIVLNCGMKRGVLTIGRLSYKSQGITKFANYGTIVIDNYVKLEGCTIVENNGTMVFKGFNQIGDGTALIIRDRFEIGEQSNIGFHSFVTDSDDHYAVNVADRTVRRFSKPIKLGRYNWIGSHTYIKKGAVTPDFLFVASPNALLAKDYSQLEPFSVIGGAPARLIKAGGARRIYDVGEQAKLNKFFADEASTVYTYPDDADLEEICRKKTGDF